MAGTSSPLLNDNTPDRYLIPTKRQTLTTTPGRKRLGVRMKKQMEEDRKMRLTMKKWFERNTTDDNLNDKTDIQRQNPKKEFFFLFIPK